MGEKQHMANTCWRPRRAQWSRSNETTPLKQITAFFVSCTGHSGYDEFAFHIVSLSQFTIVCV